MNVRPAELQCDPDPAGAWLLAWTKPRQESVARANLERQGFEAYLPMFRTLKRGADEPVLEPMFPRYLFLRPRSASQSVSVVRSTRGVASLVRFGVELATVPDSALQCIRDIERVRSEASKAELCELRHPVTPCARTAVATLQMETPPRGRRRAGDAISGGVGHRILCWQLLWATVRNAPTVHRRPCHLNVLHLLHLC